MQLCFFFIEHVCKLETTHSLASYKTKEERKKCTCINNILITNINYVLKKL